MISLPLSPDPIQKLWKESIPGLSYAVIRTVEKEEFFFLLKDSNSFTRCEIDMLLLG